MPGVWGKLVRVPRGAWNATRRRPRVALLGVLALAALLGVGVWQYALSQWRAAQEAVRQGRPQEARDRLRLCLRVWPWSTEVHLLAARAERLSGDFPAAETHLNRCLELDGRRTGAVTDAVRLEFLLMRVQSGEIDTLAARLFDEAQADNPQAPVILETLAKTYLNRMRFKPAHGCLTRWIEIEPHNPTPYQLRGWALERLNNPAAAKADYERALEQDPDLLAVRLRVVEMLLEDKQAPEALPHLERLNRQAPDDPRVQSRTGMCLFLQGRTGEARRLMEAALAHLPDDVPMLIAMANLEIQDGRGAEAEQLVRKVLRLDPSDTEALFVLASALRLQGRADEADAALAEHTRKRATIDRLNAMLKDVADSPTAGAGDHAEIGELFLQVGQDRVGVYWLERALEREPENQRAHRALAAYYEKKGDAETAKLHRQHIRNPAP